MTMKKYMGGGTGEQEQEPVRELPVVRIYGTDFLVDIQKHEFRELADPFNRMTLGDVPENEGFYKLFYDTDTKNIFLGSHSLYSKFPPSVRVVIVPSIRTLDPVGIAMRQGNANEGLILPPAVRELKCIRPQTLRAKNKRRSI